MLKNAVFIVLKKGMSCYISTNFSFCYFDSNKELWISVFIIRNERGVLHLSF